MRSREWSVGPVDGGQASRVRPAGPWQRLWELDPLALAAVAILVVCGLLNLWAIGQPDLLLHQSAALVAGVGLLLVLRRLRVTSLSLFAWISYGLAVAMLLAVLLTGISGHGARRWLQLGVLILQPTELAKLGLLLVLADVLGRDRPDRRRILLALGLAALPVGLLLLQPDLSSSALLIVVMLAILLAARVPLRAVAAVLAGMAALGPLAINLLRPYQLARLHAFLSGAKDGTNGWALLQAHVAIGSGGLFGIARQPIHLLLSEYLPARETDLAYASLVEQWGLVAGAAVLFAILVLVWRMAAASLVARTRPAALVAIGLAALAGAEAFVVAAGNLGLLPLAGVPFPFLSYGGSAEAAHLAALGLVLSARSDGSRRRLWAPPRWARQRPRLAWTLAGALTCQLAVAGTVTWHLQAANGPQLRQLGMRQITRCVPIPAGRGAITDRHGAPLAMDRPAAEVLVAPHLLEQSPANLTRLAALLGTNVPGLRSAMNGGGDDALAVKVAEVAPPVGARVAAARLPGVMVGQTGSRVYPYGPMLAPTLGFVGVATPQDVARRPNLPPDALVGRAGLEQRYDSVLRGRDGQQCFYVDPTGVPVTATGHRDPVTGDVLRLSIDLGLQEQVTSDLAGALHGNEGAAVVLDARSGQVLAMASLPSYDDNIFGPPVNGPAVERAMRAPGEPMLQHATQTAAPPGSTFKLVVGSADTVFGAIPPGQVIPTGYTFTYGDHTFHGWGPLPPQNLSQAIAWSNDVYFYKLALALGPDRIHDIGTQLGVGRPTGIDLPGESAGYLGTPALLAQQGQTWYPGTSVILGIGQGEVSVTPLQVARWTAAVTTGTLVTPCLGLGAVSGSGALSRLSQPAPTPLPFASRLGPVRDGMRQAVTQGTATALRSLPLPAGGKTGSAEDPAAGGTGVDAWFTAVVPVDHPEAVVTVFLRGGGEGDQTAEPVAQRILEYYIAHRAAILADG
jgi:cell division protein FtsI/penicillin-binding protein 2/cell division protein FtsW (lipid II flippase)